MIWRLGATTTSRAETQRGAPQPIERAHQTPHDPTGSRVGVHPAFEKLFRFIPSLEQAKNYRTYADDLLAKGFPEVSRHIANEAVNGRLRDPVPYYCVHGFSQWTRPLKSNCVSVAVIG